jgi:hypothetical protein
MNSVCSPAPSDKRKYISDLGKILVKDYGKKNFYKPMEVKQAHKKSAWRDRDFVCWGMSAYSSHHDFNQYHLETGETCDYVAMKSEMLMGISLTESSHLSELPTADLDTSWLDLGRVFSGIIDGIGEFFASIISDSFDSDVDLDD